MAALDQQTTRLVRWWVERYTAGLDPDTAAQRRAEITSDLVEHEQYRGAAGWASSRIVRERVQRALLGIPSDIGWRHDQLEGHADHRSARALLAAVAGIAQVTLAVYFLAFASFLLGNSGLADHQLAGRSPLQGFEHYANEPGSATAGVIVGALGLVLAAAALARPVSPIVSNAVTVPIAAVAVLFFWMGVWPLGCIVVALSATDLAVRGAPAAAR